MAYKTTLPNNSAVESSVDDQNWTLFRGPSAKEIQCLDLKIFWVKKSARYEGPIFEGPQKAIFEGQQRFKMAGIVNNGGGSAPSLAEK